MTSATEARAAVPSLTEAKGGDPKPVTYRVWVDPSLSIIDLCKEAGIILRLNPYKLGEWPSEPFNHDNKGKPKTDDVIPYLVDVSDGSDTVGKTWERAMKGASKDQKRTIVHEGIALVKDHPEILESKRLVLAGTNCGIYEVVQITKHHNKVELRPIFVGDTNTDHLMPKSKKLPYAVIFSSGKVPQIPNS